MHVLISVFVSVLPCGAETLLLHRIVLTSCIYFKYFVAGNIIG